jgi:5-methylcytosine-specific restriction endonuclease McrA
MEYLRRHLNDYEDATQKEPKAKRALILALFDVLNIAETVEKEVKDKATFEALFEKSVSGKTKFTKALAELSEHMNTVNNELNTVRNDRRKREKAMKKTKPMEGGAAPTNEIVSDATEDPVPVVKVPTKASQKTDETTGKKTAKQCKDKITLAMREEIWDKYIGDKAKAKCPVCQTSVIRMTGFSAGHITAEALGGVTNITNLVPICGHCNSRMSTENLFEYTLKNHMRAPVFPGLETVKADDDKKPQKVEKKSGK